jgi:nucleotide-binding universal stress UspA family protein
MASDLPRPVLVALGSPSDDDAALEFACNRAVPIGQPLLLVHVVDPSASRAGEPLVIEAAERAQQLTGGAVRIETSTPQGDVVPVLVDLSTTADIVVLQRRPFSRLQRMTLGSVSAEVAGHAHATTVTVPSGWRALASRDRRLVVGVDRASDDRDLIAHAFTRALELGADLSFVHGWQMDSGYDDAVIAQSAVDEWARRYIDALEAVVTGLHGESTTVPWTVKLVHAAPEAALVAAAEQAHSLVLGRGGGAIPLVGRLGSTTRALLRAAVCPVEVACPVGDQRSYADGRAARGECAAANKTN